jgi:hypothetical protein
MTGPAGLPDPYAPTTEALWDLDGAAPSEASEASGLSDGPEPTTGAGDPPPGTFTDPDPEQAAAVRAAAQAARDALDLEREVRWLRIRHLARIEHEAVLAAEAAAAHKLRIVGGDEFMYGEMDEELKIWGNGLISGWAPGESLMIFGPPGVGKSTLMHQLMLGRLGLVEQVLGMAVHDSGGRVFYLAADRPRQLRRAMRRFARPEWREVFADRLVLHEGPLPVDITTPHGKDWVADQAQFHKADTVIVDSIKDVCPSPSEDGPANGYNLARQECIARGIEWLEGHHNRKASDGNRRPNKLDDVYGSRWLTGGAGSVLCLWGEAGDRVIELTQLKSPAGYFNPTQIEINFSTGGLAVPGAAVTAIGNRVALTSGPPRTVLEALVRGPADGMTAKHVGETMQRTERTARTQLERHVERAEVERYRLDDRVFYRLTGHQQGEIDADVPWANLNPNTNT